MPHKQRSARPAALATALIAGIGPAAAEPAGPFATVHDVRDYGAVPDDARDDTAAIQAALDAARDAGGGRVRVPAGTYLLSGTGDAGDGAVRVYSNTEFHGDGIGVTILRIVDGYAEKITGMIRTPYNEVTSHVVIRDMTLDGNRDSATGDIDGIFTGVKPGSPAYDDYILIEDVEIHDVSRYAFNVHEQSRNVTIRDTVAHDNTGHGYVADYTFGSVYENNLSYDNGLNGFDVVTHSHDMTLRDNVAHGNGQSGIAVQRGSEPGPNVHTIAVIGNEVYDNAETGLRVTNGDNIQLIGNHIHDNGGPGMMLRGLADSLVFGNRLENNNRGDGNNFELKLRDGDDGAASTGNLIVGNTFVTAADLKYAIQEGHETTDANRYIGNAFEGSFGEAIDLRDNSSTIDDRPEAAAAFSYFPHTDPRTRPPEDWTQIFATGG